MASYLDLKGSGGPALGYTPDSMVGPLNPPSNTPNAINPNVMQSNYMPLTTLPISTPETFKPTVVSGSAAADEVQTKIAPAVQTLSADMKAQQLAKIQSELNKIQTEANALTQQKSDADKAAKAKLEADKLALERDKVSLASGTDLSSTQTPQQTTDFTGKIRAQLTNGVTDPTTIANELGIKPEDVSTYFNTEEGSYKLKQAQADIDMKRYNEQARNGTLPLNQWQQAELDSLNRQYENLKKEQELANQNYVGGVTTMGIRTGISRYATELAMGNIQSAISAGIDKLNKLENDKTMAVSKLQQAFQEGNYKLAKDAYDMVSKSNEEGLKAIQETKDKVQAEFEKTRQYNLEVKKFEDEERKETAKTINSIMTDAGKTPGVPSSVIDAISKSKTVSEAIQAAGEYLQGGTGIVGEYLYYKRQAEDAGQTPVDFNSYQTIDANRKARIAAAGAANGLSNSVMSKVEALAGKFGSEQTIKNFSVMSEGYDTLMNIDPNTTNPAENMAAIYAFAKAMDPNSVVRETEYNTVQKYSQTWLESFGFNALRVIQNKEFLTAEAIKNLQNAVKIKYNSSLKNYENLENEYARKINKITGMTDGSEYLTEYSIPIGKKAIEDEAVAEQQVLQYSAANPQDDDLIDKMLNDGASYSTILQWINQKTV